MYATNKKRKVLVVELTSQIIKILHENVNSNSRDLR
jgi:hypothetical protein